MTVLPVKIIALRVDGAALAWTVLVAIAVGAVFGLAPAFRLSRGNLQETLKDGGAGMTLGRGHERLRSGLVVSEVALVCVLLIGAGLLLRSFRHLLDVDLGFAPAHAAAIKVELNDAGSTAGGNKAHRGPVVQIILERIRAIPGIESVGMVDMLPLDRNRSWGLVAKENVNDKKRHGAFVYVITPGYLGTMGMRCATSAISPGTIVPIRTPSSSSMRPPRAVNGPAEAPSGGRPSALHAAAPVLSELSQTFAKAASRKRPTLRFTSPSPRLNRRERSWWCAPACQAHKRL